MAVDPETMEELLADVDAGERALRPFRPGEVVEGVIASVSGEHILAAVVQAEGPDGGRMSCARSSASGCR